MNLTRPVLLACAVSSLAVAQDWKPVPGTMKSKWAKDVSPANAWPQYPRPTLVREKWMNLNGLWDYAIETEGAKGDPAWRGKILVPFPVESSLSGVGERLTAANVLHYRRSFETPADWRAGGARVLLHFGAVDWHCRVSVNGTEMGEHRGGYDPFSIDITDALKSQGPNELTVMVTDPTNAGGQPRGKQWDRSHGIWYTPTSGIWQTVWLEPVPAARILGAKLVHDGFATDPAGAPIVQNPRLMLSTTAGKGVGVRITIDAPPTDSADRVAMIEAGQRPDDLSIPVVVSPQRLWSPDSPHMYSARVELLDADEHTIDSAMVSFGLRDIAMKPDRAGVNRLFLNGAPLFHFGPLDQGFWPDGLYTPPTEEAMKFDIEAVKKMGGNMLRKHVKVESERFYHLCDTMGMMVWQDMPSPFFKAEKFDENFPPLTDEWKANFEHELTRVIASFGHHPSIVMWVPFNEGWGQNDLEWSKQVVELTRKLDPSRLVNCASGWTDTGNGHVLDVHLYPGPGVATRQPSRAVVLGEYGGLGLPLEGHTWTDKANWGYVSYKNKEELTAAYVEQLKRMPLLIGEGLSAAVYTQTTDVEIEVNGWLTYDREVWKIDPARAAAATAALYLPPPRVEIIVPRAGQAGALEGEPWRFTIEKPAEGWMNPGFDASAWGSSFGGFGTQGTPGAIVGTEWSSPDIWLRRSVTVGGITHPMISIHHDEDADVYIDGVLAASLKGYTGGYSITPVSDKAAEILRTAKSVTIAVHCHQTRGGQFIDVGIVNVVPAAGK